MTSAVAVWAPPYVPDEDEAFDWQAYFNHHRTDPMAPQVRSWTCSACAIDWVALATGLDPGSTREKVVGDLGYPNCINEQYGLMDANCAVRVMRAWGVNVQQEWVTWERAYDLCSRTTGLLNSKSWYHYVAIRGVRNGNLWVANSAAGYKGIWDDVTPAQFAAWSGTWNVIYLLP